MVMTKRLALLRCRLREISLELSGPLEILYRSLMLLGSSSNDEHIVEVPSSHKSAIRQTCLLSGKRRCNAAKPFAVLVSPMQRRFRRCSAAKDVASRESGMQRC